MNNEINYNEIYNLVKDLKNKLDLLKNTEKYVKFYSNEVNNKFNELKSINYFINHLNNDITSGIISDNYDISGFSLIKSIYNFKTSVLLYDNSIKLFNNYNNIINNDIAILNKKKNSISWLFTNKEDKQSVINLFIQIRDGKYQQFINDSNQLLNSFDSLKMVSNDFIISNFYNERDKYYNFLHNNNSLLFNNNYGLISSLNEKYLFIKNKSIDIDNQLLSMSNQIKDIVNRMINMEVVKLLKDVPIEELSNKKAGIRVGLLSDCGYKNMYDICNASFTDLELINGIGEKMAYQIKSLSNEYYDNVKKSVKLKLSVDNKDSNSSEIVYAIYKYKCKRIIVDEKDNIYKQHNVEIEKSLNELVNIKDGVKYFFYDRYNKEMIVQKYNYVNWLVSSDVYGNAIIGCANKFYELNNYSIDDAWNDFELNSIDYFKVIEEICPDMLLSDEMFNGLSQELIDEIQSENVNEDGLYCSLRHYQTLGVKYILHQKKVLLGDEMGLGKTIQAIATMVSLRNDGCTHFLVICPASVVTNWYREIKKFSNLNAYIVHGQGRDTAFNLWLDNGGVAVTTFENTINMSLDIDFRYSLLVVDEAHYIKNKSSRRSINTVRLSQNADRMLFMTGTALENNVDEMITLMSFLNRDVASSVKDISYLSAAPQFREKISSVYYRRTRDEVLSELPELVESKEWCELDPYEKTLYENSVINGSINDARRVSWNVDNLSYSSKANRLKEIVEEAKCENRKVIVFSFFLDTISKLQQMFGNSSYEPITGSVSPQRRQEIIDEFDKADAGSVLIAQITAGGTGLNIQSASVVVICEPQYKPSTENQAISRAYRMGQARNVLVYRLLCLNTIDEKIVNILEEKQNVFDAFADRSYAAENEIQIDSNSISKIMEEEKIRIINEKES